VKLLRYGEAGRERPGVLDGKGRIRSLEKFVADIDAGVLAPERLAELARIDVEALPLVEGDPRIGTPVSGIGKFIAVGLNFSDHAAEANLPTPTEPIIFTKAISSITGPNDDVIIPRGSTKTDWEVELGVIIGSRASYVEPADGLRHVAGYCVVNDISERSYQIERGGTWDKGKGCDTFGPIGPWLVTRDEISDPQALEMWLDHNGARR
jgi:2-keto-4-pentenoate hydratase/2-oxohepta-3-ene-1,7-dioic acid hydratase in catechol pathway